MEKTATLDVENFKYEFERIDEEFFILNNRFIALAIDYKTYINGGIGESKINILRDNIQYRLYSAKFHIELLFNHINYIEQIIEHSKKTKSKEESDITVYVSTYTQQIASIFDSLIYHLVSVFDYIGTLANYLNGKKKENTLMWTQLAKSVRDNKNVMSKAKFANIVDEIDRDFVSKLYDHRALLIHRNADLGGYTVSHSMGKDFEKVRVIFYAGKNVVKSFKQLKKLSERNKISVRYVALWILNETIKKVTAIIFSVKDEVESRTNAKKPMIYYRNAETKETLSLSKNFWNEKRYKDSIL